MNKTTELIDQKKAVIYCRVSTKEQVDEGNSLVSQERLCREYALKEGYNVVEIFIEKGESAKTADRKELRRLMDFCTVKRGNVHAVIAYKVDRISRNIADYSLIRVRLKKYGVEIRSVTEFFEDTPAGRFMENIIANVGQFDNDVRTERCMGGMQEAALEGRYVWMAPLGYSNRKVNGKSTIVPNEMAPLMKEVFERIALRVDSTNAIRLEMAKKGLVSKQGKPIPRSHFHRLLRNQLYKGVIKKFGKTFPGTFDPIVSAKLFDDVQGILTGRMNKGSHYLHENPDFPLRRFIVNEEEKPLAGYWAKGRRLKYPYYSFTLPGTTIRKEILEQKFMDFLAEYAFDRQHLNVIRCYIIKYFHEHIGGQQNDRAIIEKRIAEIDAQIDNLIKLEKKGTISTSILEDRVGKFESELNELRGLLGKAERKDINIPQLLDFAARALKKPYILWQKASVEIQRRLQVFVFPEGLVFDGVNLRTPKLCSIFKLKKLIDNSLLPIVVSKYSTKNTLSERSLPPSEINLLESKVFWEAVVEDLKQLEIILSKNTPADEVPIVEV